MEYESIKDYLPLTLSQLDRWYSNSHEYWRRTDRDYTYHREFQWQITNTLIQYLDDILYILKSDLDLSSFKTGIISDSFIQITTDSKKWINDKKKVVNIWENLYSFFSEYLKIDTNVSLNSIGMLSNWGNKDSLNIITTDKMKMSGLDILNSLNNESIHPQDLFWFHMCQILDNDVIIDFLYKDSIFERKANRLFMLIEHHDNCNWLQLFARKNDLSAIVLSKMPSVDNIKRTERSHQAWWRYTDEMIKMPEYNVVLEQLHNWLNPQVSYIPDHCSF